MRSHKLLIVSATVLATTTLAGVSFADNTPSGTSKSTTSHAAPSSSSSTTSVTTPSSPATSTTVTTQQGATTVAPTPPTMPPATPPTSTTTITSADDVSAAAPMPPPTTAAMPPPGESTTVYQRHRPNTPLLVTGGVLLAATYATTAALSGSNGPIADRDLYLPIVGPWINLADRDTNRENNTRDTVLIAGSGVLQGLGALMLVTSFFVPENVPAARISAGNVKMQVSPTASMGGGGVGAVGTF
jgi:hypothetical protein